MKIADLANEIQAVAATGRLEAEARDVTHDSREAAQGWVFVAIRGEKFDGHRFISQALDRGAIAVISELDFEAAAGGFGLPSGEPPFAWLRVKDARRALAEAAAAVHGHPSRRLKLVGVTGTNGKTTSAHLIDSIIRAAEGTSAMFGTISHRVGEQAAAARHTTPEAADIQRMLAEAVRAGCRSAVMEVSSHAIELRRADALRFTVAAFTNLTRDHLDFHQTMDAYFAAKEKLFNGTLGGPPDTSVVNIDDAYGERLARTAKGRVLTYGLNAHADVRATSYLLSAGGVRFTAVTPAGEIAVDSKLVGRPHVYNILGAIAVGLALGFDAEAVARGVEVCRSVPGRFEQVTLDGRPAGFSVIVDYAHTDDALQKVLQTAREVVAGESAGRVITVFGCGGDRDRTKRAPMGEVAAALSDVVIVTSDNPRTEDPARIIADIEVGLRQAKRPYMKFIDRREAIFAAINEARPGDLVVIAGKGHEDYQIIGETKIHFDDRETAREAMAARRAGA